MCIKSMSEIFVIELAKTVCPVVKTSIYIAYDMEYSVQYIARLVGWISF